MKINFYYILFIYFFVIQLFSEPLEIIKLTDKFLYTPVFKLTSPNFKSSIKLIGMLHLGDKEYYEKVIKITNTSNFIFYEGVRESNISKSKSMLKFHAEVNDFNKEIIKKTEQLADELYLYQQKDLIKPSSYINWINADIDMKTLDSALVSKNLNFEALESFGKKKNSFFLKQLNEYISIRNKSLKYKKSFEMKKLFAKELVNSIEYTCYDEEAKSLREVLIDLRNKEAINKIKPAIENDNYLDLTIIYGVSHIPNFVEILHNKYKFAIESVEWLEAWNLQE